MADPTFPSDFFWLELERKYRQLRRGAEEWLTEETTVRELVPKIQAMIGPRYTIVDPIGVGGVGIVLRVQDTNLESARALKFPRPRPQHESLFAEILSGEISQLRQAVHQNIIAIFYQARLLLAGTTWPFYIMEYIEGACDARDHFEKTPRPLLEITAMLEQVALGLEHLHSLGIMHGDIKLENVLIGANRRVVISDLGSARNVNIGDPTTDLIFTRQYADPRMLSLVTTATESTRNRAEGVRRSDLLLDFDFHPLGKNLFRVLRDYRAPDGGADAAYTIKYLRLMAARLLGGANGADEQPLGLPAMAFKELSYKNATQVREDIQKLHDPHTLMLQVPELDEHGLSHIQATSIGATPFTPRVKKLVEHPLFRRLAGVTQLGFISLVYPTATHSRLEHVLGTFSNTVRYCNALLNDPINPLFRQIMGVADIEGGLLAALCHDVGQYSLAHDLEEANADLFNHEAISVSILRGHVPSEQVASLCQAIRDDWHVTAAEVAAIIEADVLSSTVPLKTRILHSLIDGPIDADKLDYLIRDADNLNLTFGQAIDVNRLLSCLTVIFRDDKTRVHIALGIHEKGKVPAEAVAFVRYAMFGAVYWHHTTRAAKAALQRGVWEMVAVVGDEAWRGRLRSALVRYVVGAPEAQLNLELGQVELEGGGQLLLSDTQMLSWLGQRTTPKGRAVLQMLGARLLYKRILVIGQQKGQDLWGKLIHFRAGADAKRMLVLQNRLEESLCELLVKRAGEEGTRETRRIRTKGGIVILVDIPTGRSGSALGLEYLPEADRRAVVEEWQKPCVLEDSIVWSGLHDTFLEAAGKIRIFCHPYARAEIDARLKREDLEALLRASFVEASK